MTYGIQAHFDTLREVTSGSITASYVAVGSALTKEARMVRIVNTTDKALYISLDGSTNVVRMPSASIQIFDFCTNEVRDDGFFLPIGTQFYVTRTEAGAPASGSIAVEVIYAAPTP